MICEMKFITIIVKRFISCYLLLLGILPLTFATVCLQKGKDYCQCSDSAGYKIDLSGINTVSNWKILNSTSTARVALNLCSSTNASSLNNDCPSGIAVCLIEVEVISIGRFSDLKFNTTINNVTNLVISSTDNKWNAKIELRCNHFATTDQLSLVEVDAVLHRVNLLLESSKACPTSSAEHILEKNGWKTLFVILFVVAFLYLAGGMVFMKVMFGASGLDTIPHRTFWISLYSNVKNALLYCLSGCRTRSAYDQI